MGGYYIQGNGECQSGTWSTTRWEISTRWSPICVMPYGIPYQNGGFQTKGQACGMRPHDWGTGYYYDASIVSRETVRIALMIPALNNLEVKSDDIWNAYVQAPVTKTVWTTLGPEFGKDAGRTAVIVWALYGLTQQEQHLGATLPDAWNPWVISLVRLTLIYGLSQRWDKKMG